MDRSEGNDDELYPSAPVPAHERPWRHPSEMGEQQWMASEPPLTIGRGLTAVTGTIGGVLALAVLWTMLPTHAGGRSAGVSVRSTVALTAALGPPTSTRVTEPATTAAPSSTSAAPTTTAPASTSSAPGSTPASHPDLEATHPTYAVATPARPEIAPAVAVAVASGSLIVTTANAVTADNTVELMLPGGGTEEAHVLLVDERDGFAVLAHDSAAAAGATFSVATSVEPGDELTVYGVEGVQAVVRDDGSIEAVSTGPSTGSPAGLDAVREGTPVVNDRGELVALCTHGEQGASFVTLGNLDELRRALVSGAASKVWLGVMLREAAGLPVAISALDPDGPAAVAGLQVGDELVAVDGITVIDAVAVGAALAGHVPGDAIDVVVRRSGVEVTVPVVLGTPRASL